jgi:hypothetical protein
MHMCMYLHVCRHVCVRHTCTYALDTAPMSQDTCRYSQIHTDTGMCISNVQCAYQICIELYPVHMSVHMCAVCDSHTCTYINPYVCYMCFTYMHVCTGRITDVQASYTAICMGPPCILRMKQHMSLKMLRRCGCNRGCSRWCRCRCAKEQDHGPTLSSSDPPRPAGTQAAAAAGSLSGSPASSPPAAASSPPPAAADSRAAARAASDSHAGHGRWRQCGRRASGAGQEGRRRRRGTTGRQRRQ